MSDNINASKTIFKTVKNVIKDNDKQGNIIYFITSVVYRLVSAHRCRNLSLNVHNQQEPPYLEAISIRAINVPHFCLLKMPITKKT